nr:twin-arginine translocation signal domain-containing protein [Nitratireductor sp. StC3]
MTRYTASRRAFLKGIAAVPVATAAGSLIRVMPATAQSPATVRMQLGWLASNGILCPSSEVLSSLAA